MLAMWNLGFTRTGRIFIIDLIGGDCVWRVIIGGREIEVLFCSGVLIVAQAQLSKDTRRKCQTEIAVLVSSKD